MKKLLLTVLTTLCITSSFAQVSWNIKAGANISTIVNIKDETLKPKAGYQTGVGMEYAFNKRWAIQTSLLLITKGTRSEAETGNINIKATINSMYIQLPVMAAVRFQVAEKINLVLTGGPYVAYGAAGNINATITDGHRSYKMTGNTFGNKKSDMKLDRLDIGMGIGFAAEFGKIIVGLDGIWGLRNVYKDKSGKSRPNNSTFALSVGYKF